MEENFITLNELSNIQNWLGNGVRIAICTSEHDDMVITEKIDMVCFKSIRTKFNEPENYKVFRIDSLDDLMCVYVTHL